jgi:hypothetical protein
MSVQSNVDEGSDLLAYGVVSGASDKSNWTFCREDEANAYLRNVGKYLPQFYLSYYLSTTLIVIFS